MDEPVENQSDVDGESKAVPVSRTSSQRYVPCWILLSIINCTCSTEKIADENMSVVTLDMGVMLRMVGEYGEEQTLILRELIAILNVRAVCLIYGLSHFVVCVEMLLSSESEGSVARFESISGCQCIVD